MEQLNFTVYCHPEPQGSSKGFPIKRANGKIGVVITSANSKLKPFRHTVAQTAILAAREHGTLPLAPKGDAVRLSLHFYLDRPASCAKRMFPVVKPDADKLCRAVLDAVTGILFADDSQVVAVDLEKHYGSPERIEVSMRIAKENPVREPYEVKSAAMW